jgi:predicted signal transduction protein with EAL and GGDEF domain
MATGARRSRSATRCGTDDGTDVAQLVRRADVAKQARAGVLRYEPGADRNDTGKLVLMTELRAAVERAELDVYYQPIVETTTRKLRKIEASSSRTGSVSR